MDSDSDMQAAIIETIGSFRLVKKEIPSPSENEVLIKTRIAGICRTDLKLVEVGHRDLTLPRVPGEEAVGVVCVLGKGVNPTWMNQRVYLYPGSSCGICPPCLRGASNLCTTMQIMGFHRDGGFAEYVLAPVTSLIPIPPEMNFETAVFAEPLSCCLNAIEKTTPRPGESALIYGAGPAGSLLSLALSSLGISTTVVEPDKKRCERIGGTPTPPNKLFDIVIPAVGDARVWDDALDHLAPSGRLVAFSGLQPNSAYRPLDVNRLHYHEQSLIGAYGCCYRHGADALALLSQGTLCVENLISDILPLSRLAEALQKVRDRNCMKILLDPHL